MQKHNKNSRSNLNSFLMVCLTCFLSFSATSQLYFPNENYYNSEIERFNIQSQNTNNYQKHLSVKPLLDTKSNTDSIYYSTGKHYYWITQKLFKENFIIFKGEDFWCSVDPIVDAELGTDLSMDSLYKMYWNTRGIRIQAKFYDKVAFTTSVYENQAIVPQYQSDFFDASGEFRPTAQGYKQENAFVPMYARTKPFKTNGYDFAFATGQLSIVPTKWLNFQLGNGNQFIGSGYRSLFLSDFSGNYPFFKTEFFAFDGKLQYNMTYAMLTNPYRLSVFSTPEATYERKIGAFHFLEYAITDNFNINLFEGSNWRSTDSLGTQKPDWLFLNPIILSNSIIKSKNSNGYNSVVGVGANYTFKNTKFYTQLLLDNSRISSQIGFKSYDLFINNLDVRVEYNQSPENAYLTTDIRYNYSNNNLSLGHPFVSGYKEIVAILSYQKDRWFVQNKVVFYTKRSNDIYNIGVDILQPFTPYGYSNTKSTNVFNNNFEFGYRFNKNYNLQAVVGYLYRTDNQKINPQVTNYVYFGIRTRLRNKKLDW